MENNIKINKRGEKFINFMKKYGYYILAAAIIIAITLSVVLTTTAKKSDIVIDDSNNEPSEVVDAYALTFDLPLLDCTVVRDHVLDTIIYNESVGWYETHHGIDLVSQTSNDVLAAAEGTIEEIYTNDSEGTVIVIKHNDVYTSIYGSLNSDVTVKVGDKVNRGQKLGTTSDTGLNEYKTGAHLHFQLFMDENEVNPADYLNIAEK